MAEKVVIISDENKEELERIVSGCGFLVWDNFEQCDLIIIDGEDFAKKTKDLREMKISSPIVITGEGSDFDILCAYEAGADDFVKKPYNPIILGAKIKAWMKRAKGVAIESVIKAGPFSYDTLSLRFCKNGEEIFLSSKENAMMKLFILNPGRIFSKEEIYDSVWGSIIADENAVMVYVNRLRRKIEDNPKEPKHINNIRGLGYRFEA